jgi:transposase InsO family protein
MLYNDIRNERAELSLNRACDALGVSKSWCNTGAKTTLYKDEELPHQIKDIALEFPRYGYRRITKQLHRNGLKVNHKRVLKLMRIQGLTRKIKHFRISTTDSKHGLPIYPNLVKDIMVTRLNQVWVSDITYIRLLRGFVYLAVIMDRFSRKCIGWQLNHNIDAQLCTDALNKALQNRQETNLTGLIHHSDQGVQYASNEYTGLLEENGIRISMSRRGNPYDNAYAESLIKTIKYDEVYMTEYESFEDAYNNIEQFLEEVYNKKRLHSGIGYMPPAEFEKQALKEVTG